MSNIVDVKLGPDVGETRRHESGWPMGHMSQGDKKRHEHPSWAVDSPESHVGVVASAN